jgi:hypothetical protein
MTKVIVLIGYCSGRGVVFQGIAMVESPVLVPHADPAAASAKCSWQSQVMWVRRPAIEKTANQGLSKKGEHTLLLHVHVWLHHEQW